MSPRQSENRFGLSMKSGHALRVADDLMGEASGIFTWSSKETRKANKTEQINHPSN